MTKLTLLNPYDVWLASCLHAVPGLVYRLPNALPLMATYSTKFQIRAVQKGFE
jgi:hypothetical protein